MQICKITPNLVGVISTKSSHQFFDDTIFDEFASGFRLKQALGLLSTGKQVLVFDLGVHYLALRQQIIHHLVF